MKKLLLAALLILIIVVNTERIEVICDQAIDYVSYIIRQDPLVGFAAVNGTVTGGENGETVTVSNAKEFLEFVKESKPLVIQISGKIELPEGMHPVASNKTIIGLEDHAEITNGGLYLRRVENVIIQNISFSKASEDSIAIDQGSHHILIDHNHFSDANDGLLDIVRGSNYITVSWNHFQDQDLTSLVGHDDSYTQDRGKLRVTYHHNWFDGTGQRQPRVRFGEVHVFNNYYSGVTEYGIGVGVEAKVVSENNYFETDHPTFYLDTPAMKGYIQDSGSYFANRTTSDFAPEGIKWNPSSYYSYKLDPAKDVKDIVMKGAGVGKLDEIISAP